MFGFTRRPPERYLSVSIGVVVGPDGSFRNIELAGRPEDVHKALAVMVRGVGAGKPRPVEEVSHVEQDPGPAPVA